MHIMRNHQGFINSQKQNAFRELEIKGGKHVSLADKEILTKEIFRIESLEKICFYFITFAVLEEL